MSKKLRNGLLLGLCLVLLAGVVQAQEETPTPRPTPTNVPGAIVAAAQEDIARGTIQGAVYEDINGDGHCVDTGVAGEGPVEGVTVQFVSSDEQTVIDLHSAPEGSFGLAAAGHSVWAVTVRPGPEWIVTSARTQFAPIYPDSLVVTGLNFCIQRAATAVIVLPISGGASMPLFSYLWLAGLAGVAFMGAGLVLWWRQRRALQHSTR